MDLDDIMPAAATALAEPAALDSPLAPRPFAGAPVGRDAASSPSLRRGLLYLALCLAFAAALVLPNLLTPSGSARGPNPCDLGAAISQAAVLPDASGGTPHLLAMVRPPAQPDQAPGMQPGCDVLYRSDDNGISWTVSFSATAEAPMWLDRGQAGPSYLLTQRLHFPYYYAGNIYLSDTFGSPWSWTRISPQGRRDVPMVTATDIHAAEDGSIVVREGNGDGGALFRSPPPLADGTLRWQPLVVPRLFSVAGVALLGGTVAVAAPLFSPDQPWGMSTPDAGKEWRQFGPLPSAPSRTDLRPVLSASPVGGALVVDLVPSSVVGNGGSVARYFSLDAGQHWALVRCAALPAPGCAPPERWASSGTMRYVLYHRRIFVQRAGGAWRPLPARLPLLSGLILQLLAAPTRDGPVLYVVAANGIWRLESGGWRSSTAGLALGGPTPVDT